MRGLRCAMWPRLFLRPWEFRGETVTLPMEQTFSQRDSTTRQKKKTRWPHVSELWDISNDAGDAPGTSLEELLSAAAARWAVESAFKLAEQFAERTDTLLNYQEALPKLLEQEPDIQPP